MQLICVPPERAAEAWPRVAHWIKAAMERVDFGTFDYVERTVLDGSSLLWLAVDGTKIVSAAVTEIDDRKRRVCNIVACGGAGLPEWVHLIEGLHDYARAEGCSASRIIGRKGWERELDGYHAKAVILERQL